VIGMAVDFGWPWWAFTTIAVVVAAASLVLLRLVRWPLAQGILLTLLIEAVAIAALAPTLMADTPSKAHGPQMNPPVQPMRR
jgi:hypothetical protein